MLMDSNNGGKTPFDRARETAAEIAREKVVASYSGSDRSHLKSSPAKNVSAEEWKKYHSAWQNYYQKYYSDYYSKAAKDYVKKEQEKIKSKTEEEKPKDDPVTAKLRSRIQEKARKNKITSRRKKLIPLFAGLAVTITILFLQYNRLIFAPIAAYVSPGDSPASSIEAVDPTVENPVSSESKLIIPKINVNVPVAFGIGLNDVNSAMRVGVAHFRVAGASAYPGQLGNTVISGHSAGDVYNNDPYKFIFSGLERLENGDLIYVNYNSVRYTYSVVKKSVVEPSDVAALTEKFDKPMIILVTCTPLGVSRYRLLVFAEQVSPSSENVISSEPVTETGSETILPSNEPSFFKRLWNKITGQD